MEPYRNQPGGLRRFLLESPPLYLATGPCSIFLLLAGDRWRTASGKGGESTAGAHVEVGPGQRKPRVVTVAPERITSTV